MLCARRAAATLLQCIDVRRRQWPSACRRSSDGHSVTAGAGQRARRPEPPTRTTLAAPIRLAIARSRARAAGSVTVSVRPSGPKLKTPRDPNPAQKRNLACRYPDAAPAAGIGDEQPGQRRSIDGDDDAEDDEGRDRADVTGAASPGDLSGTDVADARSIRRRPQHGRGSSRSSEDRGMGHDVPFLS